MLPDDWNLCQNVQWEQERAAPSVQSQEAASPKGDDYDEPWQAKHGDEQSSLCRFVEQVVPVVGELPAHSIGGYGIKGEEGGQAAGDGEREGDYDETTPDAVREGVEHCTQPHQDEAGSRNGWDGRDEGSFGHDS